MVQVLPQMRGTYCAVRSVLIAEECHVPLERGWFHDPRGIRSGEVLETDLLTEITSFFLDNPLSIPVEDTLVSSVWLAVWLLYIVASISVVYTITWCLCWWRTK